MRLSKIIPLTPVRYVDRTRTVQDWKCPRSRYWGYEHEGRGLSPSSTSLELSMGIAIHDSLAAIAILHKDGQEVPIHDIGEAAYKQMFDNLTATSQDSDAVEYAKEQATLTQGLVLGFHKHVWPRLLLQYPTIVAVETEMEFPLAEGYTFMTKPDLVMEDSEGDLVYVEYKSTSSKKENWINSWDTAVQLHSSVKATEVTLGRPVGGVQIVGLYKGYESYGKQSSPFCYAYKRFGNPPFTVDQVEYAYKAGFKRYPTWELKGGVEEWVNSMPENILATQFPMTPKIFVNDDLVEAFFRQRVKREKEITEGLERLKNAPDGNSTQDVMDDVFPQRFDQCVPSFGWSCPFRKLCHGYVPNPLEEGFTVRESHHQQEKDQHEAR